MGFYFIPTHWHHIWVKGYLIIVLLAVLNSACVPPLKPLVYAPSKLGGYGYYSEELGGNKWVVGYVYNSIQPNSPAPQQRANFIMKRAAELAQRYSFKWMKMLPRKDFEIKGSGTPYIDTETMALVYPPKVIGHIGEGGIAKGTMTHRNAVYYFEFSNYVNCTTEKCNDQKGLDFTLEECTSDPAEYLDKRKAECATLLCKDRVERNNMCLVHLKNAYYRDWRWSGMVEEYYEAGIGSGTWYKPKDIYDKYNKRSIEWAFEPTLDSKAIKKRFFNN